MSYKYVKKTFSLKLGPTAEQGKRYVNRIHIPGKKTTADIARNVARSLSIEEPEAELMIAELAHQITESVMSGQSVKVEGLGTFAPNLRTKSAATAAEVDASNIEQLVINFRLDAKLRKQIDAVPLELARDVDMKHIVETNEEEG